eukprot:3241581-Prymnesium_polylepis.1
MPGLIGSRAVVRCAHAWTMVRWRENPRRFVTARGERDAVETGEQEARALRHRESSLRCSC